ncbi:integrase core domain-containing protein [Streptomyces sp. NPDC000931]|uniref:integrase core domain-containing protein n=1 Tax=Streptomyces sp. NPDC000931 TaxID=3154372 RepID=UPI003320DC78
MISSTSTIGDCYDNAMIEPFWGRMPTELLNRHRWRTCLELANAIFKSLEIFHNRQRRDSVLSMLTPIEFGSRTTPSIAWSPATRLHVSRGTSNPRVIHGELSVSSAVTFFPVMAG